MKTMTEQELSEWVDNKGFTAPIGVGITGFIVSAPVLCDLFAGMKLVPADAVVLTQEQARGLVSYPIGLMEAELQAVIDKTKSKVTIPND